jgi:hypothetical protein
MGAVGLGYRAGAGSGAALAAPPDKPLNELEALRKENELLRLNLQVVLEKVRAQEGEIQGLRKEVAVRDLKGKGLAAKGLVFDYDSDGLADIVVAQGKIYHSKGNGWLEEVWENADARPAPRGDVTGPAKEAESALKALREAKDKEGQRRATEALDKAMKRIKEQLK